MKTCIMYNDIVNGTGIRTTLIVDSNGDNDKLNEYIKSIDQELVYHNNQLSMEIIDTILESINNEHHEGISILGVDPLDKETADELLPLLLQFRVKYGNSKSIWIYTKYKFESLIKKKDSRSKLITLADVIIDGPYMEDKKDKSIRFKYSTNQRMIDVQNTIINKKYKPVMIIG